MPITPSLLHSVRELQEKFTPSEAERIAYIPIVMERLCFEYAERFCRLAAQHKQPIVRQCRTIRDNIRAFEAKNRKFISSSTIDKLDRITADFFCNTEFDTQRLYWAINLQLKKKYACLTNVQYLLLSEAICSIVLGHYVFRFKKTSDAEMAKRLGMSGLDTIDREFRNVLSVLFDYCGDYNLRGDAMVSTGLRIIAHWANALKF